MIKQARILLLREILVTLMNHLTLFSLVLTVYTMVNLLLERECGSVLFWLFLYPVPLFFYFVRRRIPKFVPFVLLHGAVPVILLLAPFRDPFTKFLCMAGGVGYLLYSFYLKFKDTGTLSDRGCSVSLILGVPAVLVFLQHCQKAYQWDDYYYISLITSLGLYFLVFYINKYLHFLVVNESSAAHIPEREMFHSGMGLAAGYTLFGVLVLTLTSHLEWLGAVWNAVKGVLVVILRFLFGLLPEGSASGDMIQEGPPAGSGDPGKMPLPKGEPGLFWIILEYVVMAAFFIALTAVCIWGLIKLSRWVAHMVRSRFGQSAAGQELSSSLPSDVREKCTLAKSGDSSGGNVRKWFGLLQPGERIRKLYRKKILEIRKYTSEDQLGDSTTARECIPLLGSEEPALLYEKARYSNQECTAEDVRNMRRSCKE